MVNAWLETAPMEQRERFIRDDRLAIVACDVHSRETLICEARPLLAAMARHDENP